MAQAPQRIASLLASGTELVCALGAGDRLIGRSHECDTPAWVTRLPQLSRPTFDITGSSRAIDTLVRERMHAGLPLYQVDEALLAELRPEIVLTQTHCEVCAVSPGDMKLCRQPVVTLRGGTLASILEGFAEIAAVLDLAEAGQRLCGELTARADAVRALTRPLPHPTIACIEWIEPVFSMGNWGPELVDAAGGVNLLGNAGAHSTTTPWDAVRAADPDVLLVAPCGFDLARALADMPALTANPGWSELRAVRAGRVYVADGNRYFNRSSPSLWDSIEILAEILHPALPPRHAEAWRRWP